MTAFAELDIPDADFSVAALHAALDAERTRRGLTWMDVACEVNRAAERDLPPRAISASTISGLAKKT